MLSDENVLSEPMKQAGQHIRSPLALTGIMVQILRHRFDARYGMPYKWIPLDSDPHTEGPTSTIRIEAGGESNRDQGYTKPGIYVVRQPIYVQQQSLDNMSSFSLPTGDRSFQARGQTGFTMICESNNRGESSALGDLVMSTFMMGANLVEKTFNIYKLGPFSLSATVATRKDQEVHETQVSVGMQYDLKWANLNLAPMFKEIVLKSKDDTDYFFKTYTKSIITEQE